MSIIIRNVALGAVVASLAAGFAVPASAAVRQTVYADGGTMKYDMNSGEYCLSDNLTGSRIAQVTCNTKDGWKADGLIISNK